MGTKKKGTPSRPSRNSFSQQGYGQKIQPLSIPQPPSTTKQRRQQHTATTATHTEAPPPPSPTHFPGRSGLATLTSVIMRLAGASPLRSLTENAFPKSLKTKPYAPIVQAEMKIEPCAAEVGSRWSERWNGVRTSED